MTEPKVNTPSPPQRRSFLLWVTVLVGGVATALLGIPLVGYIFSSLRHRSTKVVSLGKVSDFPINVTRLVEFDNPLKQPWDGMVGRIGVFVRNLGPDDKQQPRFLVFTQYCAHLGCPVSWFPQSGLFMCPCHGGVYYENGERASGPPPRGLFHCVWEVKNGELRIQAPHLPTLQDTLTGRKSEIRMSKSETSPKHEA
jgi:Rieske Fe-S protein